ncbi:MAG: zinc ribbon domain-containing protein [Bacteroides sp.]|nr:zinc ribbon domain-containing protein [Bacteroides sp.]
MYDQSLEQLIDAVIADGVITDQERRVVLKKAASLGIDQDEIEVYLEGRLDALKKSYMPKSGKHGVVKTCPNCGATVESGAAKCKECGFAFTGIEANSSAKLLDERLRAIRGTEDEDNEKRANIISSFPIPTTREDLIEFMAALEPKALSGIPFKKNKIDKAYYEKYVECINKAELALPDEKVGQIHSSRLKGYNRKYHVLYTVVILAIILIVGGVIYTSNEVMQAREEKAASLHAEYEEWKKESMVEIEEYAEQLNEQLDAIPTPTARNWETCGAMWNKVSWSKKWDNKKYRSLLKEEGYYDDGLDKDAFKAFARKKNSIGEQIKMAHQQALRNSGMSKTDAHNTTVNEFYDSEYR